MGDEGKECEKDGEGEEGGRGEEDEEVEQVGSAWLLHQSQELKKFGVPVLHYYTLGRPHIVADVVKQIF